MSKRYLIWLWRIFYNLLQYSTSILRRTECLVHDLFIFQTNKDRRQRTFRPGTETPIKKKIIQGGRNIKNSDIKSPVRENHSLLSYSIKSFV